MYWLLKSEPQVFGYSDLERLGREAWNGIRNYQARNFLRQMKEGDLALLYHSSTRVPGVAGLCRIVREAHPDDLQFDPSSPYFDPRSSPESPRWSMVEIAPVRALPLVPLERLRAEPRLEGFSLLRRGSRLSVLPVSELEWRVVLELAGVDGQDGLLKGNGSWDG